MFDQNQLTIGGVIIVFVILVSIQYTLNRIFYVLKEILKVLETLNLRP